MRLIIVAAALALTGQASGARPARCETSDDGRYACDFRPTDRNGSFRITASGKPTYTIDVDGRGLAQASSVFSPGTRNVPLPGPYRSTRSEPGCWVSDATGTKICAR